MTGLSRREAAHVFGLGIGTALLGGSTLAGAATAGQPDDGAQVPAGLDHIVWAVPDLDAGVQLITNLTGIAPVSGGLAPGRTQPHNALLSLGGGSYLEVFCPARTGSANHWGALIADGKPRVVSYAIHYSDRFAALLKQLANTDLKVTGPRAMGRVRPDGGRLDWELLNIGGTSFDGMLPFFIDWLGSTPHPSQSSPTGVTIEKLVIVHPDADRVAETYRAIGIAVSVVRGDKASIHVRLRTPKGIVALS